MSNAVIEGIDRMVDAVQESVQQDGIRIGLLARALRCVVDAGEANPDVEVFDDGSRRYYGCKGSETWALAQRIGRILHSIGGMEAMWVGLYSVMPTDASSELNYVWDGIGEWRA